MYSPLCRAFLVELLPVLLLGLTEESSLIRDATLSRLGEVGDTHAATQVSNRHHETAHFSLRMLLCVC